MIEILAANHSHVEALAEMSRQIFESTQLGRLGEWSKESAVQSLTSLVDNENSALIAAELDGELIGMLGVIIAPIWFDASSRVAMELVAWVKPEHRSKGAGRSMFDAMRRWALVNGCNAMSVSALGDDGIAKLATSMGLEKIETLWAKEL